MPKKSGTPAILPWIAPGKVDKKHSFNRYVHKSNNKKLDLALGTVGFGQNEEELTDSQKARKSLQNKIRGIFDDDERKMGDKKGNRSRPHSTEETSRRKKSWDSHQRSRSAERSESSKRRVSKYEADRLERLKKEEEDLEREERLRKEKERIREREEERKRSKNSYREDAQEELKKREEEDRERDERRRRRERGGGSGNKKKSDASDASKKSKKSERKKTSKHKSRRRDEGYVDGESEEEEEEEEEQESEYEETEYDSTEDEEEEEESGEDNDHYEAYDTYEEDSPVKVPKTAKINIWKSKRHMQNNDATFTHLTDPNNLLNAQNVPNQSMSSANTNTSGIGSLVEDLEERHSIGFVDNLDGNRNPHIVDINDTRGQPTPVDEQQYLQQQYSGYLSGPPVPMNPMQKTKHLSQAHDNHGYVQGPPSPMDPQYQHPQGPYGGPPPHQNNYQQPYQGQQQPYQNQHGPGEFQVIPNPQPRRPSNYDSVPVHYSSNNHHKSSYPNSNFHTNLSSPDPSQYPGNAPTPYGFQSIQFERSSDSRRSRVRGEAPEAWIVFPKGGGRGGSLDDGSGSDGRKRSNRSMKNFTARPINFAGGGLVYFFASFLYDQDNIIICMVPWRCAFRLWVLFKLFFAV